MFTWTGLYAGVHAGYEFGSSNASAVNTNTGAGIATGGTSPAGVIGGGHIGYLTRLALLWGAIFAAAFIRPAALRWITAVVFSISAYALIVFEHSTTQFLTYDTFITMANSAVTGCSAHASS